MQLMTVRTPCGGLIRDCRFPSFRRCHHKTGGRREGSVVARKPAGASHQWKTRRRTGGLSHLGAEPREGLRQRKPDELPEASAVVPHFDLDLSVSGERAGLNEHPGHCLRPISQAS
jgi:hypothetical protein